MRTSASTAKAILFFSMTAALGCDKRSQPSDDAEPAQSASARPAVRDEAADREEARRVLGAIRVDPPVLKNGTKLTLEDRAELRDGERRFSWGDMTQVVLYLPEADEYMFESDRSPMSLDQLIAYTKPDRFRTDESFPFYERRVDEIIDKGSAGNDFWITAWLEELDGNRWVKRAEPDTGYVGLVMYRMIGQRRFRCSAQTLRFNGDDALDWAAALCKSARLDPPTK